MDRSGSNPGNDYAIAASLPLRSSLSATVTHCPAAGLKRATRRRARKSPHDVPSGRLPGWPRCVRLSAVDSISTGSFRTEMKRLQKPTNNVNPHLERPPALDANERFLIALFLRRYVASVRVGVDTGRCRARFACMVKLRARETLA
jgi:hypothetical protein